MKIIVLFITALFIIFLTEKKYRNRKLFFYPSLLLCPVIGVLAHAGTLLCIPCERREKSNGRCLQTVGAVLLYSLIMILGGDRSLTEWFSDVAAFWGSMDATKILFCLLFVVSCVIYFLIARKLYDGERTRTVLFLFLVCLMNICGYRWGDIMKEFMLGAETLDMFLLWQIIVPLIILVLLTKGTDRLLGEELLMNEEVGKMEESQELQEQKEQKKKEQNQGISRLINVKTLTLALILFALLTLFSVYTLNTKINNMSLYMEHLQESIDELD